MRGARRLVRGGVAQASWKHFHAAWLDCSLLPVVASRWLIKLKLKLLPGPALSRHTSTCLTLRTTKGCLALRCQSLPQKLQP
jgi:hypothetical protein